MNMCNGFLHRNLRKEVNRHGRGAKITRKTLGVVY